MSGKVKMIADARIRQDGVWLKPGDPFECSERDAADLESKTMRMAHRAPGVVEAAVEQVRHTYRRRNLTAQ